MISRRRTLVPVVLASLTLLVLTSPAQARMRMYNPELGAFMQRDPGSQPRGGRSKAECGVASGGVERQGVLVPSRWVHELDMNRLRRGAVIDLGRHDTQRDIAGVRHAGHIKLVITFTVPL